MGTSLRTVLSDTTREDLTMIVPVVFTGLLLVDDCLAGLMRPRVRDGDGECRSNEDCRDSWAPFCSEFGYCRTSDRYGTRHSQDVSSLEYQYEDYQDYEDYEEDYEEDYYYIDDYENGFNDIISEDKPDPRTDTGDIVELTDRYVAPLTPEDRTDNNSLADRSSKSHTRFTLQDFGIFPELRPPPTGESLVQVEEMGEQEVEEKPLLSCPGENIRDCVEGCVPLAQLWVYSVCVRECARRCP